VFAAAAVAVFSKESAVVLPALFVFFDRRLRALLLALGASSLAIAAYLAQRAAVLADALPRSVPFTDNPLAGAGFWTARLAALQVLGRYVWLLVWPARLSADYSYAQLPTTLDWLALLTAVAAIAAGLLWNRRALAF